MENFVSKFSSNETALEYSKVPPAVIAGGLDGALDFVQSNIDIVFVPDKVL
jgi:hypothetical protein